MSCNIRTTPARSGPGLNKQKRANLTYNYNIYNRLKCPDLIGSGGMKKYGTGTVLRKALNNLNNYGLAYPISGNSMLNNYGEVKPTSKGPFYAGKDYALGSNYFVPMGKCNAQSSSECKGQKRWVYVRNIPTGRIPLLGNGAFKDVLGCDISGLTEGRGLVGGMLEDLSDIHRELTDPVGKARSVEEVSRQ